jgi:poly(3-hydroxybutyrate) depolymerase
VPPLDADLQMRSIDVDGTERSFWIPDRRPRGDSRLIIAFHDNGDTGLKLARRSGLPLQATGAGVNIVFPDALERVWDDHGSGRRDGANDDLYFTTLVDHLRRRGEFGDRPPALVGFGENGAAFAERLAREGVHALAGVVLYGGTAREASRELTPVPVKPTRVILANPPKAGSRRPGLRTRLALRSVAGHAMIGGDTLLADWREVNDPAGISTVSQTEASEPWPLLAQLLDEPLSGQAAADPDHRRA